MFNEQTDLHQKMAKLDPRDTNGDGVVSPQEAAAYVHQYMQNASPEERDQILSEYVKNMPAEQRQGMGDAIVQSSANPVQSIDHNDQGSFLDAFRRTAQAPAQQGGPRPLEAAFGQGGALSNPMVKAGLVGLAAAIGSKMLRR